MEYFTEGKELVGKLMNKFFLDPTGPVNAYGTNNNDEWKIDGMGIFKNRAPPVIPFQDENVDVLNEAWFKMREYVAKKGHTFEEGLTYLEKRDKETATEVRRTLDEWLQRCLLSPPYFERSLEKAREQSYEYDRKLTKIFLGEELPSDEREKVGILIGRLKAALSAAAPFYNLEAMVHDPKGFKWNPVKIAEEKLVELAREIDEKTGMTIGFIIVEGMRIEKSRKESLDIYELLQILPSFLSPYCERIEKTKSWEEIGRIAGEIKRDEEVSGLLEKLAAETGRPIEDIIFAAYLISLPQKSKGLEIPPREEARRTLEFINENKKGKMKEFYNLMPLVLETVGWKKLEELGKCVEIFRIAEEINGEIRFFNWLPLIRSQRNFQGELLTYAAVCDTTNKLLEALRNYPKVWRDERSYSEFLEGLNKLKKVEPTSAKGRWCLSIYEQEALHPEIYRIAEKKKIDYLLELG